MHKKKNYSAPQIKIISLSEEEMIASSVISLSGGIELPDHEF